MDDFGGEAGETVDSVVISVARHLAFSPVALAVTEGPHHNVKYVNAAFETLQTAQTVRIRGGGPVGEHTIDLLPLLDRAYRERAIIRDELLSAGAPGTAEWTCTVWPVPANVTTPERLVLELREACYVDGALARERAVAEKLLLAALREQDSARDALEAGERAAFLSSASRELSMSLDQDGTREIVRRRALPRTGTWCIVDVVESNGGLHRLAVVHPDPAKQELANKLADDWNPEPGDSIGAPSIVTPDSQMPRVITHDSGEALEAAAHGEENLAILRELGFGALLIVPLVVRASVIGAITFVTPDGDPPFSHEEIALASELTDRCAWALDNARLYQESDALRVAANAASIAKSEFLRNISHELRTPLNAIGGYAELIEMGLRGPVTTEQRTDLTRIRRSQRHLLSLISEIIDFVRAESGRMEYRFAEVAIDTVLDDVVDMMEGSIESKGLTLERHPGDGEARVWADPDRMRQILINLVMNGVKYTSQGSGKITVSYTMTRHDVIIQVADSGTGIPPDMLESIFEPFLQLETGLSDRRGGVGLGLAISRDMARAMNGDLTVDSTLGIGSRFTLALPRAPQEAATA